MPCPFKLVICTSVLCLAVVAYWLHYHFSETTLDYILQFVPLPEHYKDRLYDFLLGEGCEPTQSITTTPPATTTTATTSSSSSSTCSTTNLTAIAPSERSTMKKNNNNTNNNNNDDQQEEEEPTRRTRLPTTTQQSTTTTITYPTTRKRKQHNFQRHEIPKIIKVFKYIMMVMIVYLHVEIFYYYFTQKCFAAQMARNIDHYTGLEIVKALKTAPPPPQPLTLSTSGH